MHFLPIEERGLKNYAGFWKRFGAGIIDVIVLIPFIFIFFYLESLSIIATYISVIISSSLYVTYTIYFHYRFGATLGKMEKKIKVTLPNGEAIGLKQAVLRSSVDVVFASCVITAQIMAISVANPDDYLSLSWLDRSEYIGPLYPAWYKMLVICSNVWILSEFFVLLFNKRKRAIHDFIAGTIVVNVVTHNKGRKVAPE